jgi:hypothetical protein
VLIVRSHDGVPIRLTEERWRHIVGQHPEMDGQRQKVLETLAGPDMIQEGDFGELLAVRLYTETPLGEKYVVVAYREINAEDGFILTAYLARRPSSRREILWKR